MNDNKQQISIAKLAKAFEKIHKGLNKEQVNVIVKEEMSKVIPSENSEVYMTADYDDEENSMGMSIYVSNPLPMQDIKELHFDKIMFEYLIRTDFNKLSDIMECINLLEHKGSDYYTIDGTPVFYAKELKDYCFQITITKELQK